MGSSESLSAKNKLSGRTTGFLVLFLLVIVSWAVFKIITPSNFGAPKNLLSYFEASLMVSAGAVGFYFVMVMGMFDFSIGANIMLSSIVGTVIASRFGLGYFGLIGGCVLTGAIVGLLNGFFYVKLHIPSMIVTTGLALIYEAVASYIAGGQSATLPADLRAFGSMPGNLILAVIAFLIAYLLLNYTRIGTYTYAIGSDEFVAKNMGINVNKYKVIAFIISGAFFGIEAVLTISYGSSMVAETGTDSLFQSNVIGMITQGSWMINSFYTAESHDDYAWAMLPYADVNGNGACDDGERWSCYNGLGWAAKSEVKDPQAAYDLISWFCQEPQQKKQAELGVTMAGYKGISEDFANAFPGMDVSAFTKIEDEGSLYFRPYTRKTTVWEDAIQQQGGMLDAWLDPTNPDTMATACDNCAKIIEDAIAAE